MSPMRPPIDAGDILTPVGDDTIARMGEVAALRSIQQTLDRMAQFMMTLNERQDVFADKLASIHTDVTVMKMQDEKIRKVEADIITVKARLDAVDLLHAEQKGMGKMATLLKEWLPAIISMLFMAITLLGTGMVKL